MGSSTLTPPTPLGFREHSFHKSVCLCVCVLRNQRICLVCEGAHYGVGEGHLGTFRYFQIPLSQGFSRDHLWCPLTWTDTVPCTVINCAHKHLCHTIPLLFEGVCERTHLKQFLFVCSSSKGFLLLYMGSLCACEMFRGRGAIISFVMATLFLFMLHQSSSFYARNLPQTLSPHYNVLHCTVSL